MPYIVCSDLTDPAVKAAAQAILDLYPTAMIADFNQAGAWDGATPGDSMFLIGHGAGTNFENYRNPADLFRDYPEAKSVMDASNTISLISCSTASEAQTLLDNGFQAAPFAVNLSNALPGKSIHAAVGPVYATRNGDVVVRTDGGAEAFGSDSGWVKFEDGDPSPGEADPF